MGLNRRDAGDGIKNKVNLNLWVVVIAYAVGIILGAKVLISPLGANSPGAVAAGKTTTTAATGTNTLAIRSAAISTRTTSSASATMGTIMLASITIILAVAASLLWMTWKKDPGLPVGYVLLIFAFLTTGVLSGQRVALGDDTSNGPSSVKKQQNNTVYDVEKIPVIKAVRRHIAASIKDALPEREQGLMMGVVIGETKDIQPDVIADFKTTGLSHILAVSGLNVSILIAALGYVLRWLTIKMRSPGRIIAFALSVAAVVFYMFITKLQPSVLRAGIMGVAALTAILASRPARPFSAIAVAALGILAVDPAALFNIGFQLSFAATLGIMAVANNLETTITSIPGGIAAAVALTGAAQLGVAPLLVLYFGRLSLVSILANVVVGPAITPATILGIVMAAAGAISVALAKAIAYPAHFCLAYILMAAKYFAGWPLASIALSPIDWRHVVAYYLLLGLLYYPLKRMKGSNLREVFPRRRLAGTITAILMIAIAIICLFGSQILKARPPAGLRAVFFDVGQGDAALVQAEDGAAILIDGGPEADSAISALRSYGVAGIDLMVVSHPHSDHINGLLTVANDYAIKQAVLPQEPDATGLLPVIVKVLDRRQVRETTGHEGESFSVGRYLKVKILSPESQTNGPNHYKESSSDANNSAIVALVEYKKVKILFAGDIEKDAEEDLVIDGQAFHVDVLKVPHHGSKDGGDRRFIEALHPNIAIISVGKNNPYHHPAPSTVARLKKVGAAVYRTDENGSVIIESDGQSVTVSTKN